MRVGILVIVLLLPSLAWAQVDVESYRQVLAGFVDEQGLVNYRGLKEKSQGLDSYLSSIAELDQQVYEGWAKEEKVAFWVNAYNALTLRSIIEAYPIKAGFFSSLAFPKNSIRQIDGVWDKRRHRVLGAEYTLDQIEHEILRKRYQEARVHMALVCAAVSCPPLRNEPYVASELEVQFTDQAQRFLNSPRGAQLNEDGSLAVSKIFDWFGEDFLWLFPEAADADDAVKRFVLAHWKGAAPSSGELASLDYDWSLNEQAAK